MDAYSPSINASANSPTSRTDRAPNASPVHTYAFTLSTSAYTPQFVKSLPDPLPLVSACPTGADLSNFDEEDESTDDGNASVDPTGDSVEEEMDNARGRTPLYYRMPVKCPTLPTLPIAVLSPEAVRDAELFVLLCSNGESIESY
ncbi:hypothetical protein CPB86DRAFT_636346 [Serendipita vermifera]|nr:hypothetical protein CPB86DRAFT_636346 [Serendipita vermifera]